MTLLYIDCINDIWHDVASSKNDYQPPQQKPVDNGIYYYENHGFQFYLKQTFSAVVDWEYVELFETLNAIMDFAVVHLMFEMDVEVVSRGVGNFEGHLTYKGPLLGTS